ncbi:MAG: flagellar biosynthesis repressor FlbT [Pseudomonadota bacterium]
MSGLVLKLQPGEQILVNGVVMQNGDRRAQLRIKTKDANILRLRDAMHPDEANTPVKRVYYAAQLVVAGEAQPEEVRADLIKDINVLLGIFRDQESLTALQDALRQVEADQFYFAMRELKRVLPMEETLLSLKAPNPEADDTAA